MTDRRRHLKIKIKTFAAESRIIREEARKVSGDEKWDLNHHRTEVVRLHCRHNHLAYGFLNGVPYAAMEAKCHEAPDFDWVKRSVNTFWGLDEATLARFHAWVDEAENHIKAVERAAA